MTLRFAVSAASPRRLNVSTAIILDCDGVMLDWIGGFRVYAERRLRRKLDPSGPSSFDLYQWLGLDNFAQALEMIEDFHEGGGGEFGRLAPLPGAVEALQAFHEDGREIHVITACSLNPAVIGMRKANLEAVFGPIFKEIHCVGVRDSKRPLLDAYAPAVWIEDKFENAIDGLEAGHKTYLIRSSHNTVHEAAGKTGELICVDGWGDIRDQEAMAA